jgi:hypothetical protein
VGPRAGPAAYSGYARLFLSGSCSGRDPHCRYICQADLCRTAAQPHSRTNAPDNGGFAHVPNVANNATSDGGTPPARTISTLPGLSRRA